MAITATMEEGITRAERTLELWHRVCGELGEGKPWAEIDCGLLPSQKGKWSPADWSAYMRARMYHELNGLCLIYRHGPEAKRPTTDKGGEK